MNPEIEKEINCIGLHVVPQGQPGSVAYAKVQARSNPRAWLIPLSHRDVTISGLALFQPLLKSAAIMKAAVLGLSSLGLARIWARNKIHLAGNCDLAAHFPSVENPAYAIFTGTESPHRKMAIQIMDERGRIAGFAKIGSRPGVSALLNHEATMLREVSALDLQSANFPKVLYIGPQKEATLLVTDTRKTAWTRSPTRFGTAHRRFLVELAEKTRQPDRMVTEIVQQMAPKIAQIKLQLSPDWQSRLDGALVFLNKNGGEKVRCSMSHGDFTPWNTFLAQGKLYVFDWEYGEFNAPQSNDLIHFVMNQSTVRNRAPNVQVKEVGRALLQAFPDLSARNQAVMIVIYVLGQVLRQLERLPKSDEITYSWDGILQQQNLLDVLSKSEYEQ